MSHFLCETLIAQLFVTTKGSTSGNYPLHKWTDIKWPMLMCIEELTNIMTAWITKIHKENKHSQMRAIVAWDGRLLHREAGIVRQRVTYRLSLGCCEEGLEGCLSGEQILCLSSWSTYSVHCFVLTFTHFYSQTEKYIVHPLFFTPTSPAKSAT